MHEYDKSSKWLIQHFCGSILRLFGVRGIVSGKSIQADFVQPRRIPDGFVEVQRLGQTEPDLYILEVATYPEARVAHQVLADAAMVYLDRHVLPEVVVLFLRREGNAEALDALDLSSPQGSALKNTILSHCRGDRSSLSTTRCSRRGFSLFCFFFAPGLFWAFSGKLGYLVSYSLRVCHACSSSSHQYSPDARQPGQAVCRAQTGAGRQPGIV